MTERDYRDQLTRIADTADRQFDLYERTLTKLRDELHRQQTRAENRRRRAVKSHGFAAEQLEREAELIDSVVRKIRRILE